MSYEKKVGYNHSLLSSNENRSNLVKCSFDILNIILTDTLTKSNTFNLHFSNYLFNCKSGIMKGNWKYMNMVNEVIDKNQGEITIKNYSNEECKAILDNYSKAISKNNKPPSRLNIIQNEIKDINLNQQTINGSYCDNDSSFFAEGLVQESTIEFDSVTYKSSTNTGESNTYIDNSINPSSKSTKIIKIGNKSDILSISREKMTQKKIPPRPESQKEITIPLSLQKLKVAPIDKHRGTHQSEQSLSPIQSEIFHKKIIVNSPKAPKQMKKQQQPNNKSPKQQNSSLQIDMLKPKLLSLPSQCLTQRTLRSNNTLNNLKLHPLHQASTKQLSSYVSIMKQKQNRESRNLSYDISKVKEKPVQQKKNKHNMTKQYSQSQNESLIQKNNHISTKSNTIDINNKRKHQSKSKMSFDIDLSESEIASLPSKEKINKEKLNEVLNLKEEKIITNNQSRFNRIIESSPIENISIEINTSDKLRKLKDLKKKQTEKKKALVQQPKDNKPNQNQTNKTQTGIAVKNSEITSQNNTEDNIGLIERFSFQKPKSKTATNAATTSLISNSPIQTTENNNSNKKPQLVDQLFKLNFKVNSKIDKALFNEIKFLK